VEYRNQNGPFKNREQLKKVSRLGEKTFEQAAGFLRVMNGDNPLDASAVHPEAYPVVEKIVGETGKDIRDLIGNAAFVRSVNAENFVDDRFGLPTVTDILKELEKPGRDPRPEFKSVKFMEGVEKITDLKPGMVLEGVVTNVANFGAFVDIGVHQDGLVHISHLADKFIKDPREVVKTGDMVRVKVLEVDVPRQRISLSMRKDAEPARAGTTSKSGDTRGAPSNRDPGRGGRDRRETQSPQPRGAMADALAKALKRT
ncbi:MAG: RNA-binding transcriptional accessory protein, partial [Proteobacteria bacterium]|nr:RNA-binding transcriptional accessory protein [Pseudomonadota bacterium]